MALLPDDPREADQVVGPADLSGRAAFVCPACGAEEPRPDPDNEPTLGPDSPWGGLIPYLICPSCGRKVPKHLAERWGELSIERAAAEWRQFYG